MTEKEFQELLDKFLEGKTTSNEERALFQLEESYILQNKKEVFKNDIEKRDTKQEIYSRIQRRIRKNRKKWLAIAASIAVLIGSGSILFYNGGMDFGSLTVSNDTGSYRIVLLEDGSKVTLNKRSELTYRNDHNGTRYLELEGEAFFEIARDEDRPFVVKTGSLRTTVLGTSFNIRETGAMVQVTVATGLVEVSDQEDSVLLKPDQSASYSNVSKTFATRYTHHELSESWFKESIKLEEIEMGALAEFMKDKYGVEFQFMEERAKHVEMSINIHKNEGIEDILRKINYISELQLTTKPNVMIEVKFKE
ncbi:MAG: FecR domain-containing protein [Sediminicola sp.]